MFTFPTKKRRPLILASSIAALWSAGLLLGGPSAQADEYWIGNGTWDNTNATWFTATNAPMVYDFTQTAHFIDSGVVTLGDNISFVALNFDGGDSTDTYSIEPSGAFALSPTGTAKITVQSTVSVTIDAPLTGSGGLDYEGGGSLTVTNLGNNYTGGTNIGGGTTVTISSDSNLGATSGGLTLKDGILGTTTGATRAGVVCRQVRERPWKSTGSFRASGRWWPLGRGRSC